MLVLTMQASAADQTSLDRPVYIGPPVGERAVTNRAFQGISSLAVSPGGRLWVTWYAGPTPGEDTNNYVVDPDGPGPVRAFDPELWVDP